MSPDTCIPSTLLAALLVLSACASTTSSSDSELAETLSNDEIVSERGGDEVEPSNDEATAAEPPDAEETPELPSAAEAANLGLGRGINFGNSLDAPRENDWGLGLDASYFEIVADAGFTHVRLPISWTEYADSEPPYTIPDGVDPSIDHPDYDNIWERVDWAIEQAKRNDLLLIVNMHNYDEIHVDPLAHEDRFLAMWEQIATRYAEAGKHVVFELLNEPHQTFDVEPRLWNEMAAKALAIVRETNPNRPVLVGPVGFNSIDRLADLELPDDQHLIATVHLYEPFAFTHQGATWVEPSPAVGATWTADAPALPFGVADYSWDTAVTSDGAKLRVDFQEKWAGFSIDYRRGVSPTEVSFTVSGRSNLQLVCRLPDDGTAEVALLSTTAEVESYSYDLRGCAEESTGIFLQTTENDPDDLLFESLVICTDRGCEEIVQTAGGAIDALLGRAAAWGAAKDVPIHLGEFGAYGAEGLAPLDDRAAWTATVQQAAVRQGMSTAYWEFRGGFGAYDLDAQDWVPELESALLD